MIEDFKEITDRTNEIAGTQEIVNDWMNEVLREKGIDWRADEILLEWVPFEGIMNLAWDKAMELAICVLESYELKKSN